MLPPTPRAALLSALAAGVVSAVFFSLAVSGDSGGLFLMFPPLFFLATGLALGIRHAGIACFLAMVLTAPVLGAAGVISLAWFLALPSYFLIRRLLLWKEEGHVRIWYPVLRALTELTLIAAASLLALSLITRGHGGLQSLLPHDFGAALKDADPDVALMMQQMPEQLGFLLFATMGSLWVLLLYGLGVLANRLLLAGRLALRASLALEAGGLPGWLLLMLGLSGLLAAIGQGDERMTGEALFVLFLLPYLLSGIARVHAYSIDRRIPFRTIWITCFYIALIFGRWPLLLVVGLGLYIQLSEMLDRRKRIG